MLPFDPGDDLDEARLNRWAHRVEHVDYGATRVTWWTFRGEDVVPDHVTDPRTWREVLEDC